MVGSRGFTWIELLVVIVIIVLLMAILMPTLQPVKKQANNTWTAPGGVAPHNWPEWMRYYKHYQSTENGAIHPANRSDRPLVP